nr:hypothetical protein [Tanacetum cinerariifolium]
MQWTHYTKDCPLKVEEKTLEEAYYAQFGVPFPKGKRYRTVAPGFYQRDNGNPLYQERRQTMEESLSKFMAESAKRHNENSNLIIEIRASMDAAIRNQGASIKYLEIQIKKISKVLQKRELEVFLAQLKQTQEIMSQLRRNQVEDLGPTIEEGEVIDEPIEDIVKTRNDDNKIRTGDVIVGKPFCTEICVKARRFGGMITIYNGNDSVTYQMA